MSKREKLQGMIQTMPDERIAGILASVESRGAPPISSEAWRERLAQLDCARTGQFLLDHVHASSNWRRASTVT